MAMLDDLMAEDQASGDFDPNSLLGSIMRQAQQMRMPQGLPAGHPSGPLASSPGLAANATQEDSAPPPTIGEEAARPKMPEDMAPPSLDFQGFLQAMGAGAIDPFGLTGRGLDALGFEHPARRLTEMRAEYPMLADMGGILGPGGVLGKAGGMAFKEFAPHLLGLAGQAPILSGIVREAFSPLRPSPRAQAGYPREGAY